MSLSIACVLLYLLVCVDALKLQTRDRDALCEDTYPDTLDVAIYWAAPAAFPTAEHLVDLQKSCPETGQTSVNFNPSRPSFIFTHGLQPLFVQTNNRFAKTSEIHPFILGWLAKGWNVGVFQWTQFADESVAHFERAEGKIWSTSYFADMEYTYLTRRDTVAVADGPNNETVADIFVRHYNAHFTPDKEWPNEVRLAGHSLGAQLVLVTLNKLIALQEQRSGWVRYRIPDRVALLDPVISPGTKPYLATVLEDDPEIGQFQRTVSLSISNTKYLSAMAARASWMGVALEYYKSSFINRCLFSSHEDNLLVQSTAFETIHFTQFGDHPIGQCISGDILGDLKDVQQYLDDVQYQMAQSHIAVVPYYFMSLLSPPLQCVLQESTVRGVETPTCTPIAGKLALSAAMSTEDVLMYGSSVLMGMFDSSDVDPAVIFPPNGPSNLCFHEFTNNKLLPRFDGKAQVDYYNVFDTGHDLYYLKPCTHINT